MIRWSPGSTTISINWHATGRGSTPSPNGFNLARHPRFRAALIGLTCALGLVFGSAGTRAQEKVDLELVLMADASGSIDDDEFLLQRLGVAQAFRNPRVASAVGSGPLGKIAVMYVEWTGPFLQIRITDWTVLSSPASVEAFAARLEKAPRELFSGGTAVGHAILYGVKALDENAFIGTRRVIDISGDGPNNRGVPASFARDHAVAAGITVNGLPILNNWPGLDIYFLDNVIGGPGAFSIPARGFKDFNAAILTKLIREIADTDVKPVQAASGR
jgi:hypothetical protein